MTANARSTGPESSSRLGPITAGWREYREAAMPEKTSRRYLKAARLAYVAGFSHALALVVPSIRPGGVDDDTVAMIAEMSAELDLFLSEYREELS